MAVDDVTRDRLLAVLLRQVFPQDADTKVDASTACAARSAVRIEGNRARPNAPGEIPHGITIAGAAQGASCVVIVSGLLVNILPVPVDSGTLYWLAPNGFGITTTEPITSGARRILLGVALGRGATTTDVLVAIQDWGTVP